MKYLFSSILYLLLASFTTTTTWKLDKAHSNMGFSVGHLSVSWIKGTFKINDAKVVANGADLTDAAITLEADVNSIDTDNDGRDKHLRTADFFDTEKYPTATFTSTSCKKTGDNKYSVAGELEMHGIKKQITLEMNVKTGINPNNDKPITGIHVTGSIKRSDFGIATSTPKEILDDEVIIEANLEFGILSE